MSTSLVNVTQSPHYISFLSFIIETTLGTTLVHVSLNIKLDSDDGENTTSLFVTIYVGVVLS